MKLTKILIEYSSAFLEIAGVAIIVVGVLTASGRVVVSFWKHGKMEEVYDQFRKQVGKSILLGLEFLVGADIIKSTAIEPSFTSVGILAVIVLIRTFLSFTLELEMNGKWPWQIRSGKE